MNADFWLVETFLSDLPFANPLPVRAFLLIVPGSVFWSGSPFSSCHQHQITNIIGIKPVDNRLKNYCVFFEKLNAEHETKYFGLVRTIDCICENTREWYQRINRCGLPILPHFIRLLLIKKISKASCMLQYPCREICVYNLVQISKGLTIIDFRKSDLIFHCQAHLVILGSVPGYPTKTEYKWYQFLKYFRPQSASLKLHFDKVQI